MRGSRRSQMINEKERTSSIAMAQKLVFKETSC